MTTPPPPPTAPTTALRKRRKKMIYRGGWSTSICDLFQDPKRHSSCCALACCGLLLSDRNAHFMLDNDEDSSASGAPNTTSNAGANTTNTRRPSWIKRFGWNIGMPIMVLIVLNVLESFLATNEIQVAYWQLGIRLAFVALIAILLYRAKWERMQVRRAVMRKLYQHKHQHDHTTAQTPTDETMDFLAGSNADAFLQLHSHDIRMAHATCSCFPKDIIYTNSLSNRNNNASDDDDDNNYDDGSHPHPDLCTCLWKTLSSLCCGLCGTGWFQCCGMCAIGQEDYEIQQWLTPQQRQVDYITFQPFSQYYPSILELRVTRNGSFLAHWRRLSQLSRNLLHICVICLLLLTLVAVIELDPKFQIENLIVVLATLGQAIVILWFVHWQWHRFDLSVDALIKYFASGFCLCTFLAMVYEMMISSVFGFASYMIVVVGISDSTSATSTPDQVEQEAADFSKEHVGIFAVFVFLNAFVVAAMVEELSKYFGYWMVETPDLMDPDELVLDNATATTASTATATNEKDNETSTESDSIKGNHHVRSVSASSTTLVSRGAGVTIAMVAVAAGFACSENLLYVFVYTPPGLSNEIATLVARSMFPIHPLCAAIQSIGIVRRDLEGNSSYQLGRSMLAAVLLHGAFDFVLMLLALLESNAKQDNNGTGEIPAAAATDDQAIQEVNQADSVPLYISIGMVIVGVLYYCCESASQRRRLQAMDDANVVAAAGAASLTGDRNVV